MHIVSANLAIFPVEVVDAFTEVAALCLHTESPIAARTRITEVHFSVAIESMLHSGESDRANTLKRIRGSNRPEQDPVRRDEVSRFLQSSW